MNVYDLLVAHSANGIIKYWELWAVEVTIKSGVVFANGTKEIGTYFGKSACRIGGRLYETTGQERIDVLAVLWERTVCTIVGADTEGIVVIPKGSKLELILPLDTLVWPNPL